MNDYLAKELSEHGYSKCEVRVTPTRTEVIIHATKTQEVVGEKGKRIKELTALIEKRFKFPKGTVRIFAEKVEIFFYVKQKTQSFAILIFSFFVA